MALTAYLRLKGAHMGEVRGSVTHKGREGQIGVIGVSHLTTAHEPVAGQVGGRRSREPFVITKEVDAASVPLHEVEVNNETITQLVLDFVRAAPDGTPSNDYSISLANASIVSIRTVMPNLKDAALSKAEIYEEVAFNYAKITWTWHAGHLTASDGIGTSS